MDGNPRASRRLNPGQEIREDDFRVLIVNTNAAFDRHIDIHRVFHSSHASGDQIGVFHQNRAETTRLDAIRRAAAVQVDLIISCFGPHCGCFGQFDRVRATKLQCHGMLGRVMRQQMQRPSPHQRR